MNPEQYGLIAQVSPVFLLVLVAERRAPRSKSKAWVTASWNVWMMITAIMFAWCTTVGVTYAGVEDVPSWIAESTLNVFAGALGIAIAGTLVLIWSGREE
jgi:hypothetical protein